MTKITKAMFKSVLEGSLGTQTDLARALNVTSGAIAQYLERNPDMKELLEIKRMSNVEKAEDVLFENLKKGTDQKIRHDSAKYIASRLGKKRGWTEKSEVEHSGEMNQNIDLSLITMCEAYNESNTNNPESSKSCNKK